MLDIYVYMYYNDVTKGDAIMDFLDRLRNLMDRNDDNDSTLAKKSGIPYTTINGLFKRGWEKAQVSTIQRICQYYNVSLDYMVYGAEGLSEEALVLAAKFDSLNEAGKELLRNTIAFAGKHLSEASNNSDAVHMHSRKTKVYKPIAKKHAKAKAVPLYKNLPLECDGTVETGYAAKQELLEMAESEILIENTVE